MAADRDDKLAQLIRSELAEVSPHDRLAGLMTGLRDEKLLAEYLAAREALDRGRWFFESEPLWLRKLSWRLIRPLMVLGIIAAVVFATQRAVDPTLGISLFLLGAASLYITVQFFSHLWQRTDKKRLAALEEEYRARLRALEEKAAGR